MLQITSNQNAQLKQWRKLQTSKGRKKFKNLLIEGEHLVDEAINENETIKYIIMSDTYLAKNPQKYQRFSNSCVQLADHLIDQLSQTQTSQGIFAILEIKEKHIDFTHAKKILLLDAIQDPGNLGTIIRTALAANFDGIILNDGTVDLYNDKVIRASQGALWKIPIIQRPFEEVLPELSGQGFDILVTALNQEAKSYRDISLVDKVAIMVGNEGQGVQEKYFAMANQLVYIPMNSKAESLNVAIAAGILMFHF